MGFWGFGVLGLPDSKTFQELFCLRLDIFQEKGGVVYLIPVPTQPLGKIQLFVTHPLTSPLL